MTPSRTIRGNGSPGLRASRFVPVERAQIWKSSSDATWYVTCQCAMPDSGCGRENFKRHLDIFLQLNPLPVFGKFVSSSLNLERRVVVPAVRMKQRGKHGRIALFPRRLVAFHELLDIHAMSIYSDPSAARRPRSTSMPMSRARPTTK